MKSIFGQNFIHVTNDDDLSAIKKKASGLYAKLLGWSGSLPSNKKALAWKQAELDAKKR